VLSIRESLIRPEALDDLEPAALYFASRVSVRIADDEVLGPQIYAVANQSGEPGYWAWRL
jgi:hypothetical protein